MDKKIFRKHGLSRTQKMGRWRQSVQTALAENEDVGEEREGTIVNL